MSFSLTDSVFSTADRVQLAERGVSLEEALAQLARIARPPGAIVIRARKSRRGYLPLTIALVISSRQFSVASLRVEPTDDARSSAFPPGSYAEPETYAFGQGSGEAVPLEEYDFGSYNR